MSCPTIISLSFNSNLVVFFYEFSPVLSKSLYCLPAPSAISFIYHVAEALAESLMEIAKHKPIEKITVNDIVEKCGTSRRTFYNHFVDKYDLISWIHTSREEKILSCFNDTDSWEECMKHTYVALLENADFFSRVIDQEGQNSFYQQFSLHSYTYMRGIVASRLHSDQIPEELDYAITAHVYGQVNCAAKWIREGLSFLRSRWPRTTYRIFLRQSGNFS